MPGAYGRTSTLALTNATLPFVSMLAKGDLPRTLESSLALAKGVQCFAGRVTCEPIAQAQKRASTPLSNLL